MSDLSFVEYVCEVLDECGDISYRKMFGEYFVYINKKPCFLICNNQAFVRKYKELEDLLKNNVTDFPYSGAKEHYIIDVDNRDLSVEVGFILEKIVTIPKKRNRIRE